MTLLVGVTDDVGLAVEDPVGEVVPLGDEDVQIADPRDENVPDGQSKHDAEPARE